MEQTANQFLGREPVGKLMKKYAVPCIISLLVGVLYNIVDQIFIANASYHFLTFAVALFLIIRTYKQLGADKKEQHIGELASASSH